MAESTLVMPAPDAAGALVFAASHNHHYLMFHDVDGFSNGVYEFGLPEEFFDAVGPRHMGNPGEENKHRLALSNGEYRLYSGTDNDHVFDPAADGNIVFTWSGHIARAKEQLQDAFDAILYLHQNGEGMPVTESISPTYTAEIDFISKQLSPGRSLSVAHRWIRLPDDSVCCLSQFSSSRGGTDHVEAVLCVGADMVLG
jgi:hypothetical protein